MVALEKRNRDLVSARRVGVDWPRLAPKLIATGGFGAFTIAAIVLGWGLGFAITGLVLAGISGLVVLGSGPDGPSPYGAVPVKLELDVTSSEGDVHTLRVIAIVKVATTGEAATNAAQLYSGRTLDDVAAAATALLESVLRAQLGGRPNAKLEQTTVLDLRTQEAWVQGAFVRLALDVESLWVGPK